MPSSSIKHRAAILASSLALISTPTHARSTTTTTTNNNIKQPLPPRRKMPYLNSNNVQQIINEASIKNKDKDPSRSALLNNNEGKNWMSLEEGIEFIPLLNVDEEAMPGSNNINRDTDLQYVKHPTRTSPQGTTSQQQGRKLNTEQSRKLNEDQTTGGYDENNAYSVQPFIPGLGKYDEYAQAWRLLGFMIDCNEVTEDDDYAQDNGSNDGGTEEGCTRYLLWAAYVDTEYTDGCGIGEYQQWDRFENKWDTTPCDYAPDGCNRCAKMDCHLENTHFSILGFFKHKNWDDWMEQLFKHEGICVWSDEEYAFMQQTRGVWPHGCIDTGKTNDNGDELYYNVRPSQNGRMAVGLYTDVYCKEDYPADTYEIETLVGNIFQGGSGGSGDYSNYDWSYEDLEESQARWDSAFDAWHICHPCVAHDLENTGGDKYSCNDDDGGGRRLGGEGCETGEAFSCYDDAGYTNVNQVRVVFCVWRCGGWWWCFYHPPFIKYLYPSHIIYYLFPRITIAVYEVLCQDNHEDGNIP